MRRFPVALLIFALGASARPAGARGAGAPEERFKAADELIEAGGYAEARDALDAALAGLKTDDARMVRYHERTGAAWLREGKIKEARSSFTAALKAAQRLGVADDWGARAYAGMGLCLRRENKDLYALRFFKKALALPLDEGTRMFAEDQIREIEGAPPAPAR